MKLAHIIILAVIQGLAELLPVSSSAHVIAAAKYLKEDPTTPQFVMLLVMLHTGTMFAVILYFWRTWKRTFFSSEKEFFRFATKIVIATGITGVLGLGLMKGIERYLDPGYTKLVSWSLTETGRSRHMPTLETPLTGIVAADDPQHLMFHVDDIISYSGMKNGEPVQSQSLTVKPATQLKDLLAVLLKGNGINTALPNHGKNEAPGVRLEQDPDRRNAVKIAIAGNEGKENRLKFNDELFVNQYGRAPMQFADVTKGEVEHLFKKMDLIAGALAAAGFIILLSGIVSALRRRPPRKGITTADSIFIGVIQGLTIPFRGFSRSGATISMGLLRGIARSRSEEFSFALAVVLTPPVIAYEAYRLMKHLHEASPIGLTVQDLMPGVKGLIFAFLAGLVALKVLSKLLEKGQWWLFGIYCFAASAGIFWMHTHGYGK